MEPSMQTGSAKLGALESSVSGAAPWLLCSSRGILWDPAEPWLRSSELAQGLCWRHIQTGGFGMERQSLDLELQPPQPFPSTRRQHPALADGSGRSQIICQGIIHPICPLFTEQFSHYSPCSAGPPAASQTWQLLLLSTVQKMIPSAQTHPWRALTLWTPLWNLRSQGLCWDSPAQGVCSALCCWKSQEFCPKSSQGPTFWVTQAQLRVQL